AAAFSARNDASPRPAAGACLAAGAEFCATAPIVPARPIAMARASNEAPGSLLRAMCSPLGLRCDNAVVDDHALIAAVREAGVLRVDPLGMRRSRAAARGLTGGEAR